MQNTEYKKNRIYYAMLVPLIASRENKKEEDINLWEKYDALPESKKIVSSDRLVDFIYGASQRYNLDDAKTEEFSRTVRQYFFNEIVDGQFARKIAELCNTSNEEGLEVLKSIKNIRPESEVTIKRNLVTGATYTPTQSINFSNNFSTSKRSTSNVQSQGKQLAKPQNRLSSTTPQTSNEVQVPIRKALKLYPKLELQTLTKSPIVSKPFLKPVKPTIKNWLTIYEELMGTGKKGTMDRGNFLFHSEATKNLPTEERQKLAQVLKSADDSSNLKIDTIKGEIVFAITPAENKMPVQKNSQKSVEKSFLHNVSNDSKVASISNADGNIIQKPKVNTKENLVNNQFKGNNHNQQSSFSQKSKLTDVSQEKQNSSISQNQQQSSLNPTSSFDQQEKNNNFQFQIGGLNNMQENNNLNNLGDENVGGMGSGDFGVSQQKKDSFNPSDDSEENISFTSRHVLPKEK